MLVCLFQAKKMLQTLEKGSLSDLKVRVRDFREVILFFGRNFIEAICKYSED